MGWLVDYLFKSSIGQKILVSITGLFLMLFLVVHLLGNLQLMSDDGGKSFNLYTYFMTHNPLIKLISYTLYTGILLHTIQGLYLYFTNRKAKGQRYQGGSSPGSSWPSKYMAHLGTIIFVFLLIHLWQFWLKMKLGQLPMIQYEGYDHPFADLFTPVWDSFKDFGNTVFYIICMLVVGFHLWHGFQSSFQTLGINHKRYTPIIKLIGKLYSILIPLGFIIIALYIHLS